MKISGQRASEFLELETALHKKSVRNSPETVAELLADEFMEFGSSGRVFDKTTIIEMLKKEAVDLQVTVANFGARELTPGVVLVTYHTGHSLRSSIWQLMDGRWQMVFHQGTRIPQ
ncbi:MAG TPA: DUF4440 domain-containing protein [Candidatus Angelobacter sp.]|jgi:hypothetical protein